MQIKNQENAYPIEALELLQEKDEENLTHEQKIALENLTRHCKIRDLETLEKLHEELSEIESLKEKHVYKLLEVVPRQESTVRSIFSKERIKLEDSEINQILQKCQSIEIPEEN